MSKKPPTPSIHARVLGDASISTGVTTIEPMSEILFAAALYVVLQRKEPISRRTIQALLWPDVSDRVAAHRLRQTLLKLRQLGMPIEESGKGHIGLNGTPVTVDYEEFLATKKFAETGNNDALVMLPAYEPRFSETYLEWLDGQKAEVNASMTRVMLGIIARHRVKGEWVEVERNATRLLRFQPYNEEATLALAEAYAMRGGKLQAMEILDRYLNEVGNGPTDLRLPATVMRRRIADRMHPRVEEIAGQSPLVGRGAEMELLANLLEKARRKKGQACLIWGDAGIGKSRLLAEFATFASLQGVPTQRVQCRPSDQRRPLSVFVDLVPGLRAMRGAIGCAPDTFEYLNRLTKHGVGHADAKSNDDPEFISSKLQQALVDLVDAVSDEGCLTIIVEDVHWIDARSAQLLRELAFWASDHSILFAFTGREPPEAWLQGLSNHVVVRQLPPLEAAASKDVVLGVVRQQGAEISEKYLDWCVTVAEGNPYFLQELANQWVERGDQQAAPPSLAAVLSDRIDRLSAEALLVLQTCALLEKNATLDRLDKVVQLTGHRMLHAINELGAAGMVVTEVDDSGDKTADRLLSRHDLLSTAALGRLTPPARAYLHRRIGAVLEMEIEHQQSASVLWACATHWQLAGNTARAFQIARSCATHLMDIGLPSAAAEVFEKSLGYCTTDEERVSVLEPLAHAHYRANAWSGVHETVAQLRSIQRRGHPEMVIHDELELMDIHADWLSFKYEIPVTRAIEFLGDPNATIEHRIRAGVVGLMMLDTTSRHHAMPNVFQSIENLANDSRVDDGNLLEAKLVFHTLCGNLQVAVESAQSLVAIERKSGNCGDLWRRLCNAAVVLRTAGQFANAERLLLEAEELARKHRLPSALGRTMPALANLALESNDVAAAFHWYEQLVALGSINQDYALRGDIASLGARLALLEHNPALARKRLAWKLSEILKERSGQRRTYPLSIFVAIELMTDTLSSPALNELESIHLVSRSNLHQGFAAATLYRALCRAGRKKRATVLLDEYVTKYRRESWPVPARFFKE